MSKNLDLVIHFSLDKRRLELKLFSCQSIRPALHCTKDNIVLAGPRLHQRPLLVVLLSFSHAQSLCNFGARQLNVTEASKGSSPERGLHHNTESL